MVNTLLQPVSLAYRMESVGMDIHIVTPCIVVHLGEFKNVVSDIQYVAL